MTVLKTVHVRFISIVLFVLYCINSILVLYYAKMTLRWVHVWHRSNLQRVKRLLTRRVIGNHCLHRRHRKLDGAL